MRQRLAILVHKIVFLVKTSIISKCLLLNELYKVEVWGFGWSNFKQEKIGDEKVYLLMEMHEDIEDTKKFLNNLQRTSEISLSTQV